MGCSGPRSCLSAGCEFEWHAAGVSVLPVCIRDSFGLTFDVVVCVCVAVVNVRWPANCELACKSVTACSRSRSRYVCVCVLFTVPRYHFAFVLFCVKITVSLTRFVDRTPERELERERRRKFALRLAAEIRIPACWRLIWREIFCRNRFASRGPHSVDLHCSIHAFAFVCVSR